MKLIGLIGGISWESSLHYYKIINEKVKEELGGLHSARCVLYSVDFDNIAKLQNEGNWQELNEIMISIAKKLENIGAELIVICANTMHKMADLIEEQINIPLIHIVDATAKEIKKQGIKKVGLLGTKYTMEQDFYVKRLKEKHGIKVIIPKENDRDIIHDVIFNELCLGIVKENSKQQYIKIIKDLERSGAEGVILGCTEIPLLITKEDVSIPVFDTTRIHAEYAVNFALSK
ncbi:MAG: aspartate/glutamate racemase family protein [Promethearchaeota archaeon]